MTRMNWSMVEIWKKLDPGHRIHRFMYRLKWSTEENEKKNTKHGCIKHKSIYTNSRNKTTTTKKHRSKSILWSSSLNPITFILVQNIAPLSHTGLFSLTEYVRSKEWRVGQVRVHCTDWFFFSFSTSKSYSVHFVDCSS